MRSRFLLHLSYGDYVLGKKGGVGKAGAIIRKTFLRRSSQGNTLLGEAARTLAWDTEIAKGLKNGLEEGSRSFLSSTRTLSAERSDRCC